MVHNNILEDLCFPAEIVGKRIRVRLDGSRLIKVHLDKNQQTTVEHKVRSQLVHPAAEHTFLHTQQHALESDAMSGFRYDAR